MNRIWYAYRVILVGNPTHKDDIGSIAADRGHDEVSIQLVLQPSTDAATLFEGLPDTIAGGIYKRFPPGASDVVHLPRFQPYFPHSAPVCRSVRMRLGDRILSTEIVREDHRMAVVPCDETHLALMVELAFLVQDVEDAVKAMRVPATV